MTSVLHDPTPCQMMLCSIPWLLVLEHSAHLRFHRVPFCCMHPAQAGHNGRMTCPLVSLAEEHEMIHMSGPAAGLVCESNRSLLLHAGLVGFQTRMGALEEALQQQGARSGSAIQVMLQSCAEVVRRIEDPLSLLAGSLGRRTRAGNALYAQWQARFANKKRSLRRGASPKREALAPRSNLLCTACFSLTTVCSALMLWWLLQLAARSSLH